MKTALIIMTIMGCDDSVTECHYIKTIDQQWQTVELCDAQAEPYMNRHQNENYPVIVAACESADAPTVAADETVQVPEPAVEAVEQPAEDPGLTARALSIVKRAIPDASALKAIVATPVRYAGEGYSWVVKRFVD